VRGKNHETNFDTGKFFQKNEKSKKKKKNKFPRFRRLCPDYLWEIHAISLTIISERYINLSLVEIQETPL
jgi:hypothetical protein